jgi:hydroxymethylbilane synthase
MAGLDRLAIDTKPAVAVAFDPHDFVPSPGQGSLCLVARDGERSTIDLLRAIEHPASRSACDAERSAARVLGGSCYLPVGAYAEVDGDRLYVVAVLTSPDGRKSVRRQAQGACVDAERIGASAGTEVLAGGGADVVASLERA